MGIFDYWPYTNFHELNLNWLVRIVREYVDKCDKYFSDNDEIIKYLLDNFDDLKNYVNDYFEELDIVPIINDKIDELVTADVIADIISNNVLSYAPLTGTLDGSAIVRIRSQYRKTHGSESSQNKGFQNGVVYSPGNDYSKDGQNYIYIWQTWGDNIDTKLVTINTLTNTIVNEQIIDIAGHGAPLCIYNNQLVSISNERVLIFNIDNPASPVLISSNPISNTYYKYVMGIMDEHVLVLDSNKGVSKTTDFETFEFMYQLNDDNVDVMQDICIDPERRLVYRLTYGPNVIHTYNADTGEKLATMSVPQIISNIGIAEPEMIDVHGKYIYYGGISAVGNAGSTMLDLTIIYTDLTDKNTSRVQVYNENTLRTFYIDYENGDPLNGDVAVGSSNYRKFKYVEDAQNAARNLNFVSFRFETDYPHSFYIYRDGIWNLNGKKTGAIRIECNIDLVGIPTEFLGNPINFTGLQPWIYASDNSKVKIRSIPNAVLGEAEFLLWSYRADIDIYTKNQVSNCFFEESTVTGQMIISDNVYIKNSYVTAERIDISKGANIHIDGNSKIFASCCVGTSADRWNLNTINQYSIPIQGTIGFQVTGNIAPTFPIYITSNTTASLTYTYINTSGERTPVGYTLTRTSETVLNGTHEFTSYHYNIVFTDTPPSLLGRMNAQM